MDAFHLHLSFCIYRDQVMLNLEFLIMTKSYDMCFNKSERSVFFDLWIIINQTFEAIMTRGARRLWPVSRGCLILTHNWSYLCICRIYMLSYNRFCNCLLDYGYVLHIVNFAILYVKLALYQFWSTRCAFRLIEHLQWFSGREKLEIRNKCENYKTANKNKSVMKLSQIRRRIGLCMKEIILRFEMNLWNLFYSS
jgi:hypothetical protein